MLLIGHFDRPDRDLVLFLFFGQVYELGAILAAELGSVLAPFFEKCVSSLHKYNLESKYNNNNNDQIDNKQWSLQLHQQRVGKEPTELQV